VRLITRVVIQLYGSNEILFNVKTHFKLEILELLENITLHLKVLGNDVLGRLMMTTIVNAVYAYIGSLSRFRSKHFLFSEKKYTQNEC
jgi:hypothetical protein